MYGNFVLVVVVVVVVEVVVVELFWGGESRPVFLNTRAVE